MRVTRCALRVAAVAVLATGMIGLTGSCRKQGPLERLGGKTDRALEKAGDAVEDAADKVKDAVEDGSDKAKDAVQDASQEAKPKAD
jgi:hypothetical protein